MKGSVFLLCITLTLLLILPAVQGATCNRSVVPVITTTYSPPGPFGTIYVESSPPGAIISVNGQNQGHAPVTITGLWPGTYTVTAELKGYEKFSSVTTISGPTRSSVYCPLVPDNTGNGLYIMSAPDHANVYLDGVSRGTTPLMIADAAAGSHEIRLLLSGYGEWKSTVVTAQGGTKTVSATLVATDTVAYQGISVASSPSGAKIILDGADRGLTPRTLNGIAPGIHILEIAYPNYTSWKSTIDVPETSIKAITANLTPEPGSRPGKIMISSDPEDALVTLDGNFAGRTPAGSALNLDTVAPGSHTVILSRPGYQPYTETVTIVPGSMSAINARLVPVSGPLAKGSLSVVSSPAGASVLLDNESVGTTPLTADNIATGDHRVTVRMKGFQDYSTSLYVTAGSSGNISATLLAGTPALHSPVFPLSALLALCIAFLFCICRKE